MRLVVLLLGVAFGVTLSRSGLTDYDTLQNNFLFRDVTLYGVFAVAVAVIAPGLWVLKRFGRTALGAPLTVPKKPLHAGNVAGGVMFGVGWAMTGMCPGPMVVNIGEGKLFAWGALAGALLGAYVLGRVYGRLTGPLRLPVLSEGPGSG